MTAEFQKAIENALVALSNFYWFLNDIQIISRDTLDVGEHLDAAEHQIKKTIREPD